MYPPLHKSNFSGQQLLHHALLDLFGFIQLTLMKGDKVVEVAKKVSYRLLLLLLYRDWNIKISEITSANSLACTTRKAGVYFVKISL